MVRLDHYTLRTRKPAETVRFYCAAVGLTEGWRPGFRFPGHWLYLGDRSGLPARLLQQLPDLSEAQKAG